MNTAKANQCRLVLCAAGLTALSVAGLVLASAWFVSYPPTVLLAAWLLALSAMVAVVVLAFRQARATGTTFFAAIGQSFKALRQFIFAFF